MKPRAAADIPTNTPKPPEPEQSFSIATLGYVFAVLMPVVGFIIGLTMLARSDRSTTGVLTTSICFGLGWLLLWDLISTGTM